MLSSYPLVITWEREDIYYGVLAALLLLSLSAVIVGIKGTKLTKFKIDDFMRISYKNILFKKRGIANLMIIFIFNIVPSILDYSLPKILMIDSLEQKLKSTFYLTLGAGFLLIMALRTVIYTAFGSRIAIIVGLLFVSAGMYLIYPYHTSAPTYLLCLLIILESYFYTQDVP